MSEYEENIKELFMQLRNYIDILVTSENDQRIADRVHSIVRRLEEILFD